MIIDGVDGQLGAACPRFKGHDLAVPSTSVKGNCRLICHDVAKPVRTGDKIAGTAYTIATT